ncbi:hypothetical protein XF24_00121 [candidate division SR1 bacterium Aalborg_AAW-1]|nr:hypothetical protein XF24_00121 [candidate division SR1 bacterium Aalborg_AAW-1]
MSRLGLLLSDKGFLDISIDILKNQILLFSENKFKSYDTLQFHLLNTINLEGTDFKTIEKIISEGSYYGYPQYFNSLDIIGSKGLIGIRHQKYLSFHLMWLYYGIGLYLRRVSNNIKTYKDKFLKNAAFHGYPVLSWDKNTIKINEYYYEQYKKYKNVLEKLTSYDSGDKTVISLDIRDYYDSLDIDILLTDVIRTYSSPSDLKKYEFDIDIENEIKELMLFYFTKGIPQSDHNYISSIIGDIYLTPFDFEIHKIANKFKLIIQTTRYVDDIKIIIDGVNNNKDQIINFLEETKGYLFERLKLKINEHKTIINEITDLDSYNGFHNKITLPSIAGEFEESEDLIVGGDTDEEIVKNIIKNMNTISSYKYQMKIDPKDGEYISKLFQGGVYNLLKRSDNKKQLELILNDKFPYYIISTMPQFLLPIIFTSKVATNNLLNNILNKKLSVSHYDFVSKVLLGLKREKYDIQYKKLLKKIEENSETQYEYGLMYNIIVGKNIFTNDIKLFQGINFQPYKNLLSVNGVMQKHFIDQIKGYKLSYKLRDYNSLLNYLLNIIHCLSYDYNTTNKEIEEFRANDVIETLNYMGFSHETIVHIKNMFNRRNKNPVSHGGHTDSLAWGVTKGEYKKWETITINFLEEMLLLYEHKQESTKKLLNILISICDLKGQTL